MNHTQHTHTFPLLLLLVPLAIATVYAATWKFMDKQNKRNAVISIVVLQIALAPLSQLMLQDYPMSFHMLGHILILLIFPPLFWSATPAIILTNILSNAAAKKILTLLSFPVIAYVIGMTVMWITNIPMLFNQGTHHIHHGLHTFLFMSLPIDFGAMIVLQLIAGLIYSLPAFVPIDSLRLMPLQRVVYLFISCLGCTVLGIIIAFNPANMYTLANATNLSPVIDLQISGLIMWVPGCLVYISKCIFILADFFKDQKLAESY